jgi:hypothetical protein
MVIIIYWTHELSDLGRLYISNGFSNKLINLQRYGQSLVMAVNLFESARDTSSMPSPPFESEET